jgi:pimeloyl-ACP methyl ester carboxylesterase
MYVLERGAGVPLVLLHGFSVDHRILLPLDPAIEHAGGWRRLYVDLPGHGRSPANGVASSQDVVDAVEAEIRERLGEQPFAILGNSFGAMIARQIAHDLRTQVLGLATIAGVFVARHEDRVLPEPVVIRRDQLVLRDLEESGEGDLATEYAELAVVQTKENAQAFLDSVHPGLAAADQDALARICAYYELAVEPEDTSREPFTQPSLFLTGRQDQAVGYRDAWARIDHYPRATFAVLDAAGHNVHLEQPALAGALVADWLGRMAG